MRRADIIIKLVILLTVLTVPTIGRSDISDKTNDPGEVCMNYMKSRIENPSSISLIEWHANEDTIELFKSSLKSREKSLNSIRNRPNYEEWVKSLNVDKRKFENDPNFTKLDNIYDLLHGNIIIKYQYKNSSGNDIISTQECYVDRNGINEKKMKLVHEQEENSKRLDEAKKKSDGILEKLDAEVKQINLKVAKTKKYGIGIIGSNIYDMGEYTDSTGFYVKYINPTSKTIKYISTTVIGYNPVKDPVKGRNNKTQVTVKGVGPIAPDDVAEYVFDYTWNSDLVKTFKIVNIRVEYTDGTVKVVKPVKDMWINTPSDSKL